jgi:hypothetical protein
MLFPWEISFHLQCTPFRIFGLSGYRVESLLDVLIPANAHPTLLPVGKLILTDPVLEQQSIALRPFPNLMTLRPVHVFTSSLFHYYLSAV